jgi:hypothetical protein
VLKKLAQLLKEEKQKVEKRDEQLLYSQLNIMRKDENCQPNIGLGGFF